MSVGLKSETQKCRRPNLGYTRQHLKHSSWNEKHIWNKFVIRGLKSGPAMRPPCNPTRGTKQQNFRWYFNVQIIRNLWWFIIYKRNFVCLPLSFTRDVFKNICRQAHYLTQRFSLTGWPCARICSFSAMSIYFILCCFFLPIQPHF